MRRKRKCVFFALWVYVAGSGFTSVCGAPEDPGLRADVYSIYSLMLTNPETSHGPDNNSIYLIEETTAAGRPIEPCVQAPLSEARRFAEVLADFQRRKDSFRKLEPLLSISKRFKLLNRAESDEFRGHSFGAPTPDADRNSLFRETSDLLTLTDVYFDRNRTLALTAISTWCGGLCGLTQWKVFEKRSDGKWESRPWISCRSIAKSAKNELCYAHLVNEDQSPAIIEAVLKIQ